MAASLNKVFMMGNLTRDPELRQAGGQQICGFGIALNRTYQTARGETREDVCYVDVEAWGRTADIVAQYARKGSPLFVEGRLRYDQWDDRETGKKRSRLPRAATPKTCPAASVRTTSSLRKAAITDRPPLRSSRMAAAPRTAATTSSPRKAPLLRMASPPPLRRTIRRRKANRQPRSRPSRPPLRRCPPSSLLPKTMPTLRFSSLV